MKALLLVVILTLAGCTEPEPKPLRDSVFVEIKLVDEIANDRRVLGLAQCSNGVCSIQIQKDTYPDCITHEVRHAFEDDWHGNTPSTEDCYE